MIDSSRARLRELPSPEGRRHLMMVALGREPADLFIRGGTVVNVYSGELIPGNIAVAGDRIAYVGPSEDALGSTTELIEAQGLFVAPGWIEPHSHAYLYYNPASLAEAVLPGGTTTIVSDDLNFFVNGGAKVSRAVMDAASILPLRYLWLARPEPASPLPEAEDPFTVEQIREVLDHPSAVGVGEAPAWFRLLSGGDELLESFAEAGRRGLVTDGHTAGARGSKLAALVAAGMRACHEAITADEALERLRIGLWTPLRHSSLRPDLPELLRIVTEEGVDCSRVILTTDGPEPTAIADQGYLDDLLRIAVDAGIPPVQAIRMVTLNPATYLHLDDHLGGVAPGRLADLVLLPDLHSFTSQLVVTGGRVVARDGALANDMPPVDWSSLGLDLEFRGGSWLEDPDLYDVEAPAREELPVIEFVSDVITRLGEPLPAEKSLPAGCLLGVHLTRDGRWVSRAMVRGFARDMDGFATTATSSGQILVFGRDPRSMGAAAGRVRALGGGVAMAEGGKVVWEASLPLAGTMVDGAFDSVVAVVREMKTRLLKAGYPFSDPAYSLLFFTADFLPGPRLTWSGVLEARTGEIVREAERIDK